MRVPSNIHPPISLARRRSAFSNADDGFLWPNKVAKTLLAFLSQQVQAANCFNSLTSLLCFSTLLLRGRVTRLGEFSHTYWAIFHISIGRLNSLVSFF
jgi:hypothetical protein